MKTATIIALILQLLAPCTFFILFIYEVVKHIYFHEPMQVFDGVMLILLAMFTSRKF